MHARYFPKLRFSLKWLMILVALSALIAWVGTQVGMVTGHFEIKGNELIASEDTVNGQLMFRYSRTRKNAAPETHFFVCTIKDLPRLELLDLKPGDKSKIRFRSYGIGPFKPQNPYSLFLSEQLGIEQDRLIIEIKFDGYYEIVIDGSK